ncbi:MAG: Unknown protein [uncultured Sulfurovum sp.]|uniref:diguanylate cyclase n=1 Tax=uncultured Sulfurovum sp. TaxID=269237 RepID=A0A6S6SXE8_9BACT|nr:MAG: Unknown protein [uncultured Sulfurovum sp.]
MSEMTMYSTVIIILLFFLIFLYKIRSKQIIQNFLNAHDNIMILSDGKNINMINKQGLKVFGYDSLKSFKLAHADISDFFLENEMDNDESDQRQGKILYIDKYTYGKKWILSVAKEEKKQVKVKIFAKDSLMDRYYQIRISKLNIANSYSLSFTDITEIEAKRLSVLYDAEYDQLTNIFNRVKVNKMLKDLSYNAKKYNHEVTLILFDIDHFKRVNDDFGHNAGDSVLRELASLVKGVLREKDIFTQLDGEDKIFARWGGEEFIILLKDVSLEKTSRLASRLRKEIEKFHFNIVKNVTCSFGVTQLRAGDTQIQFLERVDKALYEAKEKGRNQVVTK